MTLQGRLMAWVLSLVLAVWLLAAAFTWFEARHDLDELLDAHLAQAAAMLAIQPSGNSVPTAPNASPTDSTTLLRYAPRAAFQIFERGSLASRSANAPPTPIVAIDGAFRPGFSTVAFGGLVWRVFAEHDVAHDRHVLIAEQQESRSDILRAMLRSGLWPMAMLPALLAVAVWWAVRSAIAPIRRLGSALTERRPQATEPIDAGLMPPELMPLLAALNGLLERIRGLIESERRFTADAAHELRTPIAAIRAQAQVALTEADDAPRRHALQATLEGCDRAARLVDQLLTLSRLEAGAAPASAPVEMRSLAVREIAALAPQALTRGQAIALTAASDGWVQGEPSLLAVMLRNLIDNAIRYSPPGAVVHVRLAHRPGRVRLTVEDSGPGMGEADRQRLGERFFRVIGSGQAGSGLGWSIVQRIADVHAAALDVQRSAELGGLRVTVAFAAAEAAAPC